MINTIVQQRSVIPSWALTANGGDLAGAILSLQLTVTNNNAVYINNVTVTDGVLSILFSTLNPVSGEYTKILSLDCSKSGQYALTSYENGCSGIILIGSIPSSVNIAEPIELNPCYITRVNTGVRGASHLIVIQDGVETDYTLTENINLTFDSRFYVTAPSSDNSVDITIGMSDSDYKDYTTDTFDQLVDLSKVRSINNTTPASDQGGIKINIKYGGVSAPVYKMPATSGFIENVFIIGGMNVTPCDLEDRIDRYVSPDRTRNYNYMPLDDAYKSVTSGSSSGRTTYTRDVNLLTAKTYDGVQLFDTNTKYDRQSS